ncbi:MAG: 16S rRNA (guanine(527)-N(7))-methyltransferase RsmG, partial [Anaerolineae bacterium]|nr:16S rRNA (guanine(527)-N(7))-methyltransferase RsmG [Anaerolineae bacterium]
MQRLIDGAKALGLGLTDKQITAFQTYYDELVAWNQKFNLTAITEYEQVQIRHFADSLSVLLAEEARLALSRPHARVIDVGSGAGFPGIPLKLVYPSARLTLLEATGKKVTFLEHLVERLGLVRVTAIKARAEELGHDPRHRAGYDLALARAVADMAVVAEYTLPF